MCVKYYKKSRKQLLWRTAHKVNKEGKIFLELIAWNNRIQ